MSILDYYKYAQLSTAAYVRVGISSWDGATFVGLASSDEQDRLPSSIATDLFNPANADAQRWILAHYYGSDNTNDPIASADKSGFAASLFTRDTENGTERVLAIRGTEPKEDGLVDLISADLGQIGVFGIALTQTISMVNLIQRLLTPEH